MTSSNGKIFRVTGILCGEFTGHRWIPHTKASDAELWRVLRSAPEQLSKQWRHQWFETPSRSLWRHCFNKILKYQQPCRPCHYNFIFDIRSLHPLCFVPLQSGRANSITQWNFPIHCRRYHFASGQFAGRKYITSHHFHIPKWDTYWVIY